MVLRLGLEMGDRQYRQADTGVLDLCSFGCTQLSRPIAISILCAVDNHLESKACVAEQIHGLRSPFPDRNGLCTSFGRSGIVLL